MPDDDALRISLAGLIRVQDAERRFLFWATREAARRHIEAGDVETRGTRRRIRVLIWRGAPMAPRPEFDYDRPEPLRFARSCANPWNCCSPWRSARL